MSGPVDQSQIITEPGRTPRRWNRGLWIRFALAITPLIVFSILGYLQTH